MLNVGFIIVLLSMSISFQVALSLRLTTKTCIHLFSIRATCAVHLILLVLIIRVIFSEAYSTWSSSLRHLLQSPVSSPLLGGGNTALEESRKRKKNINKQHSVTFQRTRVLISIDVTTSNLSFWRHNTFLEIIIL